MKIKSDDLRTSFEILLSFFTLCLWLFYSVQIDRLEEKVRILKEVAENKEPYKTPKEKFNEEMYKSTNWDNLHPEKRALTEWWKSHPRKTN